MLADLPRGVERLLRDVGVPAAPLPREALWASGAGRFVLFDSHRRVSVLQSQVAQQQGLTPIDLRTLCTRCDELESVAPVPHGHGWSESAGQLLSQLKLALERLGGIWARVADFPFPFQSALCVSLEYSDADVGQLPELGRLLPPETTHFVPTRYRPESAPGTLPHQVSWRVTSEDCLSSSRRTISHWKTRLERFREAGMPPAGVWLADPDCRLPGTSSLGDLGLRYLVQPHVSSPRIGASPGGQPAAAWVDAGLSWLPPRERFVEWVAEHYHGGRPLFVAARAEQADVVHDLQQFHRDAQRCSLLWQTSLADWTRFWLARRQVRFEISRGPEGIMIQSSGDLPAGDWGVELWRGGHFATLPLRPAGLQVADEGLPFLLAPHRNPAGCAVPAGSPVQRLTIKPQSGSGFAIG